MKKSYIFVSICIIFFLSLFIFQKINLTTADLGRHILNGELLLKGEGAYRQALLHTNFFSFTNPDFPFTNHHWGSGILIYIFYSILGFGGLSFLYGSAIILSVLALYCVFKDKTPIWVSAPILLFLIPLVGERTEVRPEAFSYLFIAITTALLYAYTHNELNKKWLYIIPVISLIFVNTHIYFIFMPFIIGMFLFETLVRRDFAKSKILGIITGISSLVLLINPYGISGVLYPFTIFKNYGYKVAENQSVSFLINYGITNPNFLWWKISTAVLLGLTFIILMKYRSKFPIALSGIALTFAVLSFFGIRHLTIYGIMLIPAFLSYAEILYKNPTEKEQKENHIISSVVISITLLITILVNFSARLPWGSDWGMGLKPGSHQSAEFFKKENLKGPIFSNYDIGGYLIFHFYPTEKVFVDNRPEAYPATFFENEYKAMQENREVWEEENKKWNFNAIYFYRHDITPWAQKFLITRIQDPEWAPVFVDNYTIIFLRRTPQNAEIIKKYELPKSMFIVE